jgi:hypothetical protein
MATNLRSNDTIQVRIPQGGGSVRDVPLSELNEYISTEEAADITTLETYVGTYAGKNDISTDLATVYAQYHLDKYDGTDAPGATDDSTEGYSVGSKWYDAVGGEWYVCTDATEDAATWAQTTVDSADLGTAAVADIVNDLTTGGTADALSAEQGKELKSTLNTEAGYIDALQAVAPTAGAPITAQVSATAITSDGNNDEITWTAVANGEDGNGISIDITLSAEATDIDITVDGKAIAVAVKTGEGTTATDVLTAVNAHETAGLLVQGVLTGSGGAITAYSIVTDGGKDITAGLAGAIRYEANKIWISVAESTASESNWKYAALS